MKYFYYKKLYVKSQYQQTSILIHIPTVCDVTIFYLMFISASGQRFLLAVHRGVPPQVLESKTLARVPLSGANPSRSHPTRIICRYGLPLDPTTVPQDSTDATTRRKSHLARPCTDDGFNDGTRPTREIQDPASTQPNAGPYPY